MDWIELLRQAEQFGRECLALLHADSDLLNIVPLYALAVAWLAGSLRFVARSASASRVRIVVHVLGGLLRLLVSLLLVMLGLLFAVARAAGRSTFYAGSRF